MTKPYSGKSLAGIKVPSRMSLAEHVGQNSEQKETIFYDLIAEKFNIDELLTQMEVLPNLHNDFVEEVSGCEECIHIDEEEGQEFDNKDETEASRYRPAI